MPRRATIDEKDVEFSQALSSYRSTGEKKYRDIVFFRVQEACYAVAKRLLGSVRTKNFSGKVLDATCKVMVRLDRNGEKDTPKKLSTFCYVYVLKALYDPHTINEEKQVRMPEKMDNLTSFTELQNKGDFDEFSSEEDWETDGQNP